MAISNGFDEALVIPALTQRKGWKQPTVTPFPVLTGDVVSCVSGLPFNADHAACSPVLLYAVQEDSAISDEGFNEYLLGLQASVIMGALNSIFPLSQLLEGPKVIFSKDFRTAYKPIPNTGSFCGWQLDVAEGDYAVRVDSIGLLLSAPCTVTLYLYNDVKREPLWQRQVTVTAGQNQEVVAIDDLVLHYADSMHKTGTFFLGYYQDELNGQTDGDGQPVTALDVYLDGFSSYSMVGYQSFQSDSDFAARTFVRQQYRSSYRTFGLNLELSAYHDFSNAIVRNAGQFDRLLGMCMIEKCIGEVMGSRRTDSDQRIGQQQLDLLYRTLQGTEGMVNTRKNTTLPIIKKKEINNNAFAIAKIFWRKLSGISCPKIGEKALHFQIIN